MICSKNSKRSQNWLKKAKETHFKPIKYPARNIARTFWVFSFCSVVLPKIARMTPKNAIIITVLTTLKNGQPQMQNDARQRQHNNCNNCPLSQDLKTASLKPKCDHFLFFQDGLPTVPQHDPGSHFAGGLGRADADAGLVSVAGLEGPFAVRQVHQHGSQLQDQEQVAFQGGQTQGL